jgi:hypothetical protein
VISSRQILVYQLGVVQPNRRDVSFAFLVCERFDISAFICIKTKSLSS